MNEGLCFEDFDPGNTYFTRGRTITETDLVNFATQFGFFESLFMDRGYVAEKTEYQRPLVLGRLPLAWPKA